MIDNQLAAPFEQIGQRLFSAGRVEDVVLVNFDPRQLATLPAQLIAQMREFLFLHKKRFARVGPLVSGDD